MAAPRSWSVSRRSVSSFPSPARPKPEAPGTMRILIAGGGSGGHILPALAVVRSLRERRTDVDPLWVGGHRGLEASLVPGAHIPLTRLWLRSLRTVDRSLSTFLDPLRLAGSIPPALLLLPRSEPPARALPGPCYVPGTPPRPLAGLDGVAARERLGIETSERVVLVFGGSQAVRRFDDAVDAALPSLVQRATVIHVTGEAGYGAALRRREALPEDRRQRYRPYAFLREEMADALVAADLVVGRAGSSTLAEVTALGLPMVVVPYPHAGGHQRANARTLGEAGAAIVIEDAAFDGDALLAAASVLDDPARLAAMGAASRSLGRRGAAEANAELLLALAERRPLPGDEVIAAIAPGAAGPGRGPRGAGPPPP